jgi:transposase InsO family protein
MNTIKYVKVYWTQRRPKRSRDKIIEFHQELKQYLKWYNNIRPHESLDYKSPTNYILNNFNNLNQGKSQML